MLVQHGKFKVYFRIPFFIYFIAKEKDCPVLCLVKKVFNPETGLYRWVKIWKELTGSRKSLKNLLSCGHISVMTVYGFTLNDLEKKLRKGIKMAKVVITITDREMIDIETQDINVTFDFEPELKDDSVTKAQMLAIKILNFIKGKKED